MKVARRRLGDGDPGRISRPAAARTVRRSLARARRVAARAAAIGGSLPSSCAVSVLVLHAGPSKYGLRRASLGCALSDWPKLAARSGIPGAGPHALLFARGQAPCAIFLAAPAPRARHSCIWFDARTRANLIGPRHASARELKPASAGPTPALTSAQLALPSGHLQLRHSRRNATTTQSAPFTTSAMVTTTAKTQMDFILNPVGVAPLLPSAASLMTKSASCLSPSWSSGSPSSVAGWSGEQAVLAALLRAPTTPVLRRKRNFEQLPGLAAAETCKRIRTPAAVLPSIFEPLVSSPTVDSCVSAATSSEGESSDLDSPKKGSAAALSHKKKTRLCKEKGCTSLAVSRRSCVRHGGGSRCTFEGCTNGAKLRNRCFQHGGSTICLAAGCNSKAKRYGYCWSHGGGRICSHDGCVKVAAQGGSCWAHGGGNRCKLEGCSKRSYQKYGYHSLQLQFRLDLRASSGLRQTLPVKCNAPTPDCAGFCAERNENLQKCLFVAGQCQTSAAGLGLQCCRQAADIRSVLLHGLTARPRCVLVHPRRGPVAARHGTCRRCRQAQSDDHDQEGPRGDPLRERLAAGFPEPVDARGRRRQCTGAAAVSHHASRMVTSAP
ncbi:hypothetical protein PHYPSEUDO_005342 [Phytophthora pseudosyringae]|uniref:WRKY19-like zinc finger domain-containing protein n=1 Tax=Phytophthora pseudosyringae TaxID=221518 RepID=A0A8T1VMB9_9STRA|nr:hypothetical protein PHYPSEUDO_005342 [Phytophthora pseudosyringae]